MIASTNKGNTEALAQIKNSAAPISPTNTISDTAATDFLNKTDQDTKNEAAIKSLNDYTQINNIYSSFAKRLRISWCHKKRRLY